LVGALPHPYGSDLLGDPRAGQVARRLVAIADVVPERELVEVLVAQLPQRVDSIAGLLLTAPRLPRLEERARARRLERAGRAERDDVAQAEALTAVAAEQAEAVAAARDLAAIKALPPNERAELERIARQHPMLRGRDRPPPALLRAELLNAYRRTRRASA
jgi:hypothetical protein